MPQLVTIKMHKCWTAFCSPSRWGSHN